MIIRATSKMKKIEVIMADLGINVFSLVFNI